MLAFAGPACYVATVERVRLDRDDVAAVTATLAVPRPHEVLERLPSTLTLRVIEGADRGKTFVVRGTKCTGGRRRPEDEVDGQPVHAIELEDKSVSTAHFQLIRRGEEVWLRDLGSTNGTWAPGRIASNTEVCIYPTKVSPARFWAGSTLLELEEQRTEKRSVYKPDHLGKLRGSSAAMRDLYSKVERIAPTTIPVLICGETGSGKSALAETIHASSGRRGPLVTLNCATLNHGLAESQLLGHRRGAFTGATHDAPGFFEAADGGTLFLDELCEMPLELQAKLLCILDADTVTRVGETTPRRIDVRLLCATNRNIHQEVTQNRFRRDLFHRVEKLILDLPPLRERKEDIALLARHFTEQIARKNGIERKLDDGAIRELEKLPWEGNVRQLMSVLQRTLLLVEHTIVTTEDLHRYGREWGKPTPPLDMDGPVDRTRRDAELKDATDAFQREYCLAVLDRFEGNVRMAADHAGYSLRGFRDLLFRLQIAGKA